MKKSTFILAAAAMLLTLAGCEKKNPATEEKQASGELIEKTFYANQGGKQKTTLDFETLATLWSEGDAIKVYSEAGGEGNDFTLESGVGESAATFTGLTTPSDFYVAFYPAGKAQSISGSTVTFNIPDTQTVTEAGSFDTNTVPMVGYTTDNTLAMMNVGSLFELGLKAKEGTPKVVKIELKDNNSENLAGDFTVDANVSGQPTATFSANGATTLTINCGEYSSSKYQGIALNASSYTYFYISIPAGVFEDGFTATLTDAEGKVAEVTTTQTIYSLVATLAEFRADNVEFKVPTTGEAEAKAEAGVPGNKVKWVQLWKGGPKWAEYNVGATTATGTSSYGGYYAWGGSQDKVDDHNTGTGSLTGNSDTATKLWGGNWRMPTKEELQALLDKCDVVWKSEANSGYGVAGRLYTGKTEGYTANSVFFPAAGYCRGGEVNYAGSYGYYWPSTPSGSYAFYLQFYSGAQRMSDNVRSDGYSVRAVLAE